MNELTPVNAVTLGEIEIDYMVLDTIIEDEFNRDKENLIMMLQAIQRRYNYLPRPALAYLSEKIDISLSHIYSVGTFYSSFSLEPKGRNIVSVCLGTACHVRGGGKIREKMEQELNISSGQTTKDMAFTLETVRCIGCCSLGPVVKINEDIHGRLKLDDVPKILERYQ
jgi:NADH-quinone oxidoreductase subunit E